MNFAFKPIVFEDWEILLKWRNDPAVRQRSISTEEIKEDNHKQYIKNLIKDENKKQYLFLVHNNPAGTIRQDIIGKNSYELSYIISPNEQGKKLGELMIRLFIHNKEGEFLCAIKKDNIASIKAAERSGFELRTKKSEDLLYYILKK